MLGRHSSTELHIQPLVYSSYRMFYPIYSPYIERAPKGKVLSKSSLVTSEFIGVTYKSMDNSKEAVSLRHLL